MIKTLKDAILTKSDKLHLEIDGSFLFDWLSDEIARNRRNAEQATAIADRLAALMAGACADGQWREVRTAKLATDRAYIIRRPGTTSLELATWHAGWRTILGCIANGGELEVWEPNNTDNE